MCNGKTTSSTQKIYREYPSQIIGGGYFSLKNSLGFHQEILAAYKNDPVPDSPAIPAMLTDVTPVSDYPYNSLTSVSGQVPYPVPDMRSHCRYTVPEASSLRISPHRLPGNVRSSDGIRHRKPSHCAYPYPVLLLREEM